MATAVNFRMSWRLLFRRTGRTGRGFRLATAPHPGGSAAVVRQAPGRCSGPDPQNPSILQPEAVAGQAPDSAEKSTPTHSEIHSAVPHGFAGSRRNRRPAGRDSGPVTTLIVIGGGRSAAAAVPRIAPLARRSPSAQQRRPASCAFGIPCPSPRGGAPPRSAAGRASCRRLGQVAFEEGRRLQILRISHHTCRLGFPAF